MFFSTLLSGSTHKVNQRNPFTDCLARFLYSKSPHYKQLQICWQDLTWWECFQNTLKRASMFFLFLFWISFFISFQRGTVNHIEVSIQIQQLLNFNKALSEIIQETKNYQYVTTQSSALCLYTFYLTIHILLLNPSEAPISYFQIFIPDSCQYIFMSKGRVDSQHQRHSLSFVTW